MPDTKYSDSQRSLKFSLAEDYPFINFSVVKEMYRQVGDLVINQNGHAVKGLLVRHLVLPDDVAGTDSIMRCLAANIILAIKPRITLYWGAVLQIKNTIMH